MPRRHTVRSADPSPRDVGEKRGDREGDERNDCGLLEEEQAAEEDEECGDGVALVAGADEQNGVGAYPCHGGEHRQGVQSGCPPGESGNAEWGEEGEEQRDEEDGPPAEDDVEGAQQCQRCHQLQHDEAEGGADPVQRREVGDDARDEERCGHHVTVVVVEEIRRREEVLGAGAADEDEVVPVEVALERQDRADDELDRDQDDGG